MEIDRINKLIKGANSGDEFSRIELFTRALRGEVVYSGNGDFRYSDGANTNLESVHRAERELLNIGFDTIENFVLNSDNQENNMTLAILHRNFGREEETARLFNIVANEIIRNGTVAENMGILAIIANALYFGHGVPANENFAIRIFENIIDNGLKNPEKYANNNHFIRSLTTLAYINGKNNVENNKPLSILNKLYKDGLFKNKKQVKEINENLKVLDEMKKEKIATQIKNQQDIQQQEKEELEREKQKIEEDQKRKEEQRINKKKEEKLKQQKEIQAKIEKLKQQLADIQKKREDNKQVINYSNHSIERNNIEINHIKKTLSYLEKQIADTQEQIKNTAILMAQTGNLTTEKDQENIFKTVIINKQQAINIIDGDYIMNKVDGSGNEKEVYKLSSLFFEKKRQNACLKSKHEQNQSQLEALSNENERLKTQVIEIQKSNEGLKEREEKIQISLQKLNS